jgi:hypothetical protein
MSGIVGSKLNIRGSGRIAKLGTDGQVLTSAGAGTSAVYEDAAGGGLDWQSVVTASTLSATAGNAYPINTTSNACTVTLPGSASTGDQIQFADYARQWGSNAVTLNINSLKFQGASTNPVYSTSSLNIIITYIDATKGWIPTLADTALPIPLTQKAIFALGADAGSPIYTSITNLVTSAGVVGSDVSEVGGVTKRDSGGGLGYGGDKGIVFAGTTGSDTGVSNLISNAGVIASDTSAVGTAKQGVQGATYGNDKGIFAFGYASGSVSTKNLVTSEGVMGADIAGVGTARLNAAGCSYGSDLAIFAYGSEAPGYTAVSNLVDNQGVVATDTAGVGTARGYNAGARYGGNKGIYAYGYSPYTNVSNLVSTLGIIGTDVTGVGTAYGSLGAATYGGDKVIFAFGSDGTRTAKSNLVTNVGVVGTDVTGVGTARYGPSALGYSLLS